MSPNLGQAWRWLVVVALAVLVVAVVSRGRAPSNSVRPLDFTLKDMNGRDVRMSDFRGHPVLINLWATWCEPCKLEIPELIELQDTYRSRGLTILGVSVDDSAEELRKFAAAYKMNYPVLVGLDHDDILAAMGYADGVPLTVMVRPDGSIKDFRTGLQTKSWFDEQIRALF